VIGIVVYVQNVTQMVGLVMVTVKIGGDMELMVVD
jgi:hypothetical protein